MSLSPPITREEHGAALMICGINATNEYLEHTVKQLRGVKIVPKSSLSAIIPSRRAKALKRLDDIETELGRLDRSLAALKGMIVSLKSDVLHLTDG